MATGEPLRYVADKKKPFWTLLKITCAPQYVGMFGLDNLTLLRTKHGPLLLAQTSPKVKKQRNQSFSKPKKVKKSKRVSNAPTLQVFLLFI